MVNFLKHIGQWFLGKSEAIEKLDAEVKAVVNTQTKRAFAFGAALGVVVTIVIIKLM